MKRFLVMMLACVIVGGASMTSVCADEHATVSPQALAIVRRIAIQHNGRNKPLDSFARETLQLITGSSQIGHEDPVATALSIMANPEHWQQVSLVSVPFVPLRDALGMDRKATHIAYNDLVATRKLMRMLPMIVQKQQREEKLSILENETMDAFQRFAALSALLEQKLNLVPQPPAPMELDSGRRPEQRRGISALSDQGWRSIQQPDGYPPARQDTIRNTWNGLISAVRAGNGAVVVSSARHTAEMFRSLNPAAYPAMWRLDLELFYNHAGPFRIARILYLLAVIALLVSLTSSAPIWSRIGWLALTVAFVLHGSGITMRVILGGRPPVSNFFETTLWLPFVAVTIALILERVYRARYIAMAAALLAAIMLVLADHLPLDSSISPVVAVLHSNLWLTIHVLTIVASYGALALATVLAHVYAVMYLARRGAHPSLPSLGLFLYRVIQVGVVLLAGGVMLGAVWANASWGRYWGWDPKETWALITLLWFLAILHGRFAGWIKGVGFALSTIGGFFLLLMTYYGVSFYLVGLHSYAGGHAKPLPLLLIAYLVAEVAFLALVGFFALNRRRLT